MMMDNGISLADIAAVTKNDEMNGMNGLWNNPFIYLIHNHERQRVWYVIIPETGYYNIPNYLQKD